VTMAVAALPPSLGVALPLMALVGACSIAFMSTGNSTLQLGADPTMRGRVMALWFVAFQGSTPIGGPEIGALMAIAGPRGRVAARAITALVVAALRVRQHLADHPLQAPGLVGIEVGRRLATRLGQRRRARSQHRRAARH